VLTRNQVNALYKELTLEAQKTGKLNELFRKLALEDLFFLITVIFGREDVNRDWLYERCTEVQKEPDGYLDLWFREGYKSSLITYGLTIQDILKDPNVTVGIFSYNRPTAKAFLRQIKREFELNGLLKGLFPDVLWVNPAGEAPKWSEDEGIVVKRKTNPKESTVEAWGLVDGQPTGRHFSLVVYDDVVTLDSVTTPEMCQKTIRAWEMSRNLGAEGGKTRYIGTRYSYNDAYGEILRREVAKPRIYPVYTTDPSKPVLLSPERVAQKRKELGVYVFSSQMLQNPVADEAQNFKEEWLQTWPVQTIKNLRPYILVDPASKKKKNSDYTAMMVIGLGIDKNYYIIDMIRDRLNLTERTQVLFGLHKMYHPVAVGYEEYGMQSDIEHLQYVQEQENYRFPIYPLGGNVGKEDRIRALVPIFEQKRMFLLQMCIRPQHDGKTLDLTKVFIEEYKTFPVGQHDDMMDALARVLSHGPKGIFATFPEGEVPVVLRRPPTINEVAQLEREEIWEEVRVAHEIEMASYEW